MNVSQHLRSGCWINFPFLHSRIHDSCFSFSPWPKKWTIIRSGVRVQALNQGVRSPVGPGSGGSGPLDFQFLIIFQLRRFWTIVQLISILNSNVSDQKWNQTFSICAPLDIVKQWRQPPPISRIVPSNVLWQYINAKWFCYCQVISIHCYTFPSGGYWRLWRWWRSWWLSDKSFVGDLLCGRGDDDKVTRVIEVKHSHL